MTKQEFIATIRNANKNYFLDEKKDENEGFIIDWGTGDKLEEAGMRRTDLASSPFYTFNSLIDDYDYSVIDTDDVQWAFDDYDSKEGGYVVVSEQIVNPENEQKLIYEFVSEEYAASSVIEREFVIETDRYCDWTSERSKFIDYYANLDNEFDKKKAVKAWNDLKSEYSQYEASSCYAIPDAEDIVKEIEELRD